MLTHVLVLAALLVSSADQSVPEPRAPSVQAAPTPSQPTPTQADIDRLQAQAFELRVRLAEADQQAGLEKARRAALELERLKQEANGLSPAVRALLQLPPLPVTASAPAAAPASRKP